jgi:hypothetical protein
MQQQAICSAHVLIQGNTKWPLIGQTLMTQRTKLHASAWHFIQAEILSPVTGVVV